MTECSTYTCAGCGKKMELQDRIDWPMLLVRIACSTKESVRCKDYPKELVTWFFYVCPNCQSILDKDFSVEGKSVRKLIQSWS